MGSVFRGDLIVLYFVLIVLPMFYFGDFIKNVVMAIMNDIRSLLPSGTLHDGMTSALIDVNSGGINTIMVITAFVIALFLGYKSRFAE